MTKFDNVFLMGDIYADRTKSNVENFCQLYDIKHLIKVPTCYKNPDNPSTIYFILTNTHCSFQNSCAIETRLSDLHKMIVTVLKTYFKKQDPEIINYQECKNFSNENYQQNIFDEFQRMQCSHESRS